MIAALESGGVGAGQVARSEALPSSQTVILLVKGEDRRFVHVFGANREFSVAHIDRDWVAGLDVFYLGGLFVMPGLEPDALADLLAFCRSRKVVTVVDVVVPQDQSSFQGFESALPHIDYFLPNEDEAQRLTGRDDPDDQIRAFRKLGAHTVIVTCGENGAVAFHDGKLLKSGIFAVEVVDPSGSGDAFTAGAISGIARGWEMPRVLSYGAALGSSATRAVGCTDSVFDRREAESFLESHSLNITCEDFGP
jgi:sugar/nucleoside kinase (ribokinase family)